MFNHELRESRFHICTLTSVLNITNDFEVNRYKSEHSVMHYWHFILSKWITPFLMYFGTRYFLYVHKKINKLFVLPLMDNKRVLLYQTNEGLIKNILLINIFKWIHLKDTLSLEQSSVCQISGFKQIKHKIEIKYLLPYLWSKFMKCWTKHKSSHLART